MDYNWLEIAAGARNGRLLKFLVELAVRPELRQTLGASGDLTEDELKAREAMFDKFELSEDERGAIRAGSRNGVIDTLDNTQTADPTALGGPRKK